MNRRFAFYLIATMAVFTTSADAGMNVALKCDLTRVQAQLDSDPGDSTSLEIDIQMTNGLAVWKGDLDSAFTVENRPMIGFATYERVEQLIASGVNFKMPRNAGSGIAFSNTRGLCFVIVFLEGGVKTGAAIPVDFSPFGVGMGPPDDRWHSGGYFHMHTGDWEPWQNNRG